ncbi:DUF6279 family lipoprotein [Halopseudomonas sabulinigri]|uniref:DUF6279 family lipoprotein n=1 Tax=Halopseudomonas sabulinigri TaxID=472181 RepID=A0ABP9ZQ49_9GAMM
MIRRRLNQSYPSRRTVRQFTVALLALLISACSATQLTYRNLDWLISRKVNQLVDLNGDQQAWFDNQLQNTLRWHCAEELPRYRAILTEIGQHLLSQDLQTATLEADAQRAEALADALLARSAPLSSGLLQRLNDEQVAELQANLAEQLAEQREELLDPPLDEQREHSAERVEKMLKYWLGRLQPDQQTLVAQWASTRDGNTEIWLDNRAHWHQLLFDELPTRHHSDFSQRIHHLIVDYRELQTPRYAQQEPLSRQAFMALLVQVMQSATVKQRDHLTDRLEDLTKDLQALECSTE